MSGSQDDAGILEVMGWYPIVVAFLALLLAGACLAVDVLSNGGES